MEHVVSLTPLGVINEEHDEVSRVHLGFLFRMEVSRRGEPCARRTSSRACGSRSPSCRRILRKRWRAGPAVAAMERHSCGQRHLHPGRHTPAARGHGHVQMELRGLRPVHQRARILGRGANGWRATRPAPCASCCPRPISARWTRPPSRQKIYAAMESYVNQGLFRLRRRTLIYM